MAQHDYVIANGTGAAVRSDLNNALAAIVSQNSGATEPATTYAFQFWADTTTSTLKLRNSANNAWIELMQLDGTLTMEDGTEALPGLSFRNDLDTGLWRPGANQLAISTNAVERVEFGASEVVFNDGGANYDFRVEGDTNANLLFVDASADAVGIGSSSPGEVLDVVGQARVTNTAAGSGLVIKRSDSINANGALNFTGSDNTVDASVRMATDAADALTFQTAGSEKVRITSGGAVGIGTTSPVNSLVVSNGGAFGFEFDTSGGYLQTYNRSGAAYADLITRSATVQFRIENSEKARIDSSGRLLVGTSSAPSVGDSAESRIVVQGKIGADTAAGYMSLARGQAATALTSADTELGQLIFSDSTGGGFASIRAFTDAAAGTGDYPGRLVFSTTADGASSPTERMRLTSSGTLLVNKQTPNISTNGVELGPVNGGYISVSRASDTPLFVNRNTNDGTLVQFDQDGTTEGTISVSGTTVSLNGAHLSRWSQLSSGAERIEILRGSVLSNLDEMCEWGDEENEQLNRMKVSDVEGDKNVAGVFQAWDDDDDTYINDFYCAMTGDFIIRIAADVTVERGDLLMSAGDGTAKPQDDDIIRSKTIAKVTSTHVTCTYDDGSYCVPCVLMAC